MANYSESIIYKHYKQHIIYLSMTETTWSELFLLFTFSMQIQMLTNFQDSKL